MSEQSASHPSRRLLDPATGREVEVLYALPPGLFPVQEEQVAGSGEMGEWMLGLRRHWWVALVSMLLGVVLGVFYALAQPNMYTAMVVAMPPSEKGGGAGKLGQYADLAAMAGVSMPGGGGSVEEILAILDSRDLAGRLVREFDLASYYSRTLNDDLLADFRRDFTAKHDKKSNRITISCANRDAKVAAAIANRAVEELQSRFNGIRQTSSRRERTFLEARLRVSEGELLEAQEKLAVFQRQHHAIEIQSQTKATVEAISKLQGELIAQQVELRSRLAAQANADNPAVQLLQQRVEELTKAIMGLSGSGVVQGGREGPDPGVFLGLGTLPELTIQYLGLYREVKKVEAIVSTLIAQIESARIAEVRDAEVITIIDQAIPPGRKSGPARSQMVMMAGFAGLMIGVVLVVAASLLAGRGFLKRETR